MRIAIVRLSALGDIINSLFVLQFIKESYPHSIIDWICEEAHAPILHHHPDLRAVHTVNLKQIKNEKKLSLILATIKYLKSLGPYDLVIDMQGLIKSALVSKYLGKNVHGYDKRSAKEGIASWFYQSTSHISYEQNSIERNAFIVSNVLNLNISHDRITQKEPSLFFKQEAFSFQPLLYKRGKDIVFVIGSSDPKKNYPKEQFAELAKLLGEHNILLVWGSADEKERAEWIAKHTTNTQVVPQLDHNALKALIAMVDLTIGNDTGPTHIAWAMNRPSITIFGPSPMARMFKTEYNLGISSGMSVDEKTLQKKYRDIDTIKPEYILPLVEELL
jgi:heptosyltransferase-1